MNLNTINGEQLSNDLNQKGFSLLKQMLSPEECKQLIKTYEEGDFRKTINMARYRFGSGEYKYYNYPLPAQLDQLRGELYAYLAPIANHWMNALKVGYQYPSGHREFLDQCHLAGQIRPTPLILKYGPGDYNTLHQDLYGEVYFPLQAILFLNEPGNDYEGGELVLTEQVPRAQSKAMVIRPNQGDIAIITTQFRPEKGSRGYYRKNMRHGVSEVTSGSRHTIGIIFHDAV